MRISFHFGLAAILTAAFAISTRAQPAGAPTKPDELLSAFTITFEQGKYDLAAEYLKAYLATNPTDQQLLDIEKRYGKGAFQNLQAVPKWSDDPATDKAAKDTVKALTDRVRAAADKILRNPDRITKFVNNLGETYEEKIYAINELRRTGDIVVPYLVKAYTGAPTPELAAGILEAIEKLDAASVAGWLAALDGFTPEQRFNVFRAILARSDALSLPSFVETDFTPFLWYLAALPPEEAPALRKLVFDILSQFTPGNVAKQDPVERLTSIARTFYEHRAKFRTATAPGSTGVILWKWDPQKMELLRQENTSLADAEEHYGLRYARWALNRKPDYEPAQRLILAIAAERAVAKVGGDLGRTAPDVHKLLSQAPTPLLADMLTEAMARKKGNLVLALTQSLSERADKTVAAQPPMAKPPLLVRALEYPDVRVQLAAANGLLRAPGQLTPEVRARILEIMKGAAGADTGAAPDSKGMALVVDPNRLRNDSLASLLRFLGYTVEQYTHGRDVLRRLGQGADYDIVLVDRHVPDPQLNDFLSQVRADLKSGGVPVAVVASSDKPLAPTLDGLLLRLAILIAATETEVVEVPPPFVPNIKELGGLNEETRAKRLLQRDSTLRTVARNRQARLQRVIDNSNMFLSDAQRAILKLRIEQVTWAVLGVQYPITPQSSPETAAYVEDFNRRLTLQPSVAPYNSVGMDGLLQRIERLQIDVDEQPVIKERYDRYRAAVDVDSLGIDIGRTRDEAVEAMVAKVVNKYPGVSVIPQPYSRVGFEEDLQKAYADTGRPPRDANEKLAAARLAVDWLRQMATGEIPGFDATAAAAELKTALGSNDLAPIAIDGVAKLNTGDAQQALVNLALSATRPAPIRAKAADAAIRHIQANGKMIPQTQIAALVPLADSEPDADVRAKLTVLKGLLAFDAGNFLQDLQQFQPKPPAPPMPVTPMPAPAEKS